MLTPMSPQTPASLEANLPSADFLDVLSQLIAKTIVDGGWKFCCQSNAEGSPPVQGPLASELLSMPHQLMPLVLHRANHLFVEAYGVEASIAYRLDDQGPCSVVPEFEPGVGTASAVLWGLVFLEAFDELAREPAPSDALPGHVCVDSWWGQWVDALEGVGNARVPRLLEPDQPNYTLAPRRLSSRSQSAGQGAG